MGRNKNVGVAVTARSWVVLHGVTGRVLYGKDELRPRSVASLAKLLTCLVALRKCTDNLEQHGLQHEMVSVSSNAASMPGTCANLREGDLVSTLDLM